MSTDVVILIVIFFRNGWWVLTTSPSQCGGVAGVVLRHTTTVAVIAIVVEGRWVHRGVVVGGHRAVICIDISLLQHRNNQNISRINSSSSKVFCNNA
jgi:hypothetical protein